MAFPTDLPKDVFTSSPGNYSPYLNSANSVLVPPPYTGNDSDSFALQATCPVQPGDNYWAAAWWTQTEWDTPVGPPYVATLTFLNGQQNLGVIPVSFIPDPPVFQLDPSDSFSPNGVTLSLAQYDESEFTSGTGLLYPPPPFFRFGFRYNYALPNATPNPQVKNLVCPGIPFQCPCTQLLLQISWSMQVTYYDPTIHYGGFFGLQIGTASL